MDMVFGSKVVMAVERQNGYRTRVTSVSRLCASGTTYNSWLLSLRLYTVSNFLRRPGSGCHAEGIAFEYSLEDPIGLHNFQDLNVTLKDLSGTVPGTINYKVLDVGSYGKDITVGAAMILANVSVFIPKPSKHYLNITKRNVVEVFRKDTVLGSGSG
ncbi:transposase, MuDR, MULE transposase domain protein [Tanacetum coccineum]